MIFSLNIELTGSTCVHLYYAVGIHLTIQYSTNVRLPRDCDVAATTGQVRGDHHVGRVYKDDSRHPDAGGLLGTKRVHVHRPLEVVERQPEVCPVEGQNELSGEALCHLLDEEDPVQLYAHRHLGPIVQSL
jgi:hypothetical protein